MVLEIPCDEEKLALWGHFRWLYSRIKYNGSNIGLFKSKLTVFMVCLLGFQGRNLEGKVRCQSANAVISDGGREVRLDRAGTSRGIEMINTREYIKSLDFR